MALATDSDFLIYQMRISFLRTQDPTGERILTFDDLHMPRSGRGLGKARYGSGGGYMGTGTSSPMSQSPQYQRRRNTSASEVRQQVAQNSNANAYIVGCGYYSEIDAVGSPPIEYTDNPYVYPPVNRPIAPYNHKEQNLPKQPPLAQRGVIPRNRSMKRNNRSAKVAPTEGGREEVVGVGVVVPRHPEIMGSELEDEYDEEMEEENFSLRRSLDTEWRRAADVTQKTAESTDAGSLSDSGRQQDSVLGSASKKKTRKNRTSNTIRLRRPTEQTDSTASSNDNQNNSNLSQLKRSVTLPTKRRSPGATGVLGSRYGRSRWAGGVGAAEGARQVSGWVGGATGTGGDSDATGWDDNEGDGLSFDSSARGRRGGADTQTWYGPRRGVRPVSVLPPPGAAPMPLRFGAEDSDDDIDLDEDDGLLGPSLSNNNPNTAAAAAAVSSSTTGRSVVSTTVVSSVQTARPSMDSKSVSFDNDMKDIEENAFVPDEPPLTSGLASLLQGNTQLKQNIFAEEFGSVSGTSAASGRNDGLKLQCAIHCKGVSQKVMQLQVRPNATVEQMIGYSLLEYLDDGGQLPVELQDVVMWVLRITDEGKVDDDFPALDRTRAVSGLGVDEFAVCLATPDQIRLNEEARVRQGRPARMPRPLSTSSKLSSPAMASQRKQNEKLSAGEYRFRVAPRTETSAVVLQPSRIATAGLAAIFVGTTPLATTGNDLKAASAAIATSNNSEGNSILSGGAGGDMYYGRGEPRLLRVRIMGDAPTAEALQTTTVETDNNATIGMVLAQICRKRPFVKEDHFVLGVMNGEGEFVACGPDMPVARIPRNVDLCLQLVDNEGNPLVMEEAEAAVNQQQPLPAIISANTQPIAGGSSSSVYHTFRVIRRAQMLFTRHERTLVIDGDVVTLMPSEHRTTAESSKTLTFHISNILCQRNQKSPRRIRLFVSRRGNAGDKTIDLEAASEEDAFMICTIITRLHDQYSVNGNMY